MNLTESLFGARAELPRVLIDEPPPGVVWRSIRPKPNQSPVRAWVAEKDTKIRTDIGQLQARAGDDYIVQYGGDDHSVVRGDIFERTYESLGGGLYRKRSDIILRYFTYDRPALVCTLEGPQAVEPGDWIVEGVAGELWPVPQAKAKDKYDLA